MAPDTPSPTPLVKEHYVRPIPFKAHRIVGFEPEMLERYYEDD